jgi:hypothetical protein
MSKRRTHSPELKAGGHFGYLVKSKLCLDATVLLRDQETVKRMMTLRLVQGESAG